LYLYRFKFAVKLQIILFENIPVTFYEELLFLDFVILYSFVF
jgi:hypothetical protein